jgi:hypothetical protein
VSTETAEEWARRQRRYELEGGTLQIWKCAAVGCSWHTVADSASGARAGLLKFGQQLDSRALRCPHVRMIATGSFQPPDDFR